MDEVTLSKYCDEAKELVRADSYDQAIAICRHILKHYPKYVTGYRLLGEACLEKGDYVEAANLFKRVLGADLEDMVVYVGLGIIFDEQGAVEEAVWQLERAFELNPGNAEIRKELQRLYAERDGTPPPKLKLTPAALGRLYMREELYQRAIDEFRGVLEEDPDRADIQVALAQALWWSEQRQEAAKVCEALLQQYPNCLKADLILGEILLNTGREAEARGLLDAAQAMDPENVVAHELFRDKSPLPPETVSIPRLDREELEKELGELSSEAPAGARTEGPPSGAERRVDEATPDWLRKLQEEEKESVPDETAPSTASQEMPAWLRELAEESPAPTPETEEAGDRTHGMADEGIPAWLGGLGQEAEEAPSGEAVSPIEPGAALGPEEVSVTDEEMAEEALETSAPSADMAAPLDSENEGLPVAEAGEEEAPDWLRTLRPDTSEQEPVAESHEETPAWMRGLRSEAPSGPTEVEPEPTIAAPSPEDELPAQEELGDISEQAMDRLRDTMPDESASIDEIMAWMDKSKALLEADETVEAHLEEAQGAAEEFEPSPEGVDEEQTPTWLRQLRPEAEGAEESLLDEYSGEVGEEEAIPTREDEIPSWLMELRPKGAEGEEVSSGREEAGVPEKPEAMIEEGPPEAEETPSVELGLREEAAMEGSLAAPEEPDTGLEETALPMAEQEEMPSWLRELRAEARREEPSYPAEEEEILPEETELPAAEKEEMPSWLRDLRSEASGEEPSVPEEEPEIPLEEGAVLEAGEEEVPSWLRQLRAEAVSEEPPYSPDQDEATPEGTEPTDAEEEEMPSWLRDLRPEADRREPAAEETETVPEEDLPPRIVEAELPSWLEELKAEVAREGVPPETDEIEAVFEEAAPPTAEELARPLGEEKEEEEVPSWLRELRTQAAEGQTDALLEKAAADEVPSSPLEEEELPSWLRDLRGEAADSVAPAPPTVAETPAAEEAFEELEVVPQEPAVRPAVEEEPPVSEVVVEEEETPAAPPPEKPPEETPQPDWAIEQYVGYLETNPRDHTARLALARAYSQAGDLDQAATQYEAVLSLGGMIEEITADLEATAEMTPDHMPTHELLADAYMRGGQLQKALEKYRWLRVMLAR
jgi:tetratricopeptide (TPR) repeat protein